MNKAFYIAGTALSVIFIFVCAYYASEVSSARIMSVFEAIDSFDFSTPLYSSAEVLTEEAGIVIIFFLLFFLATDLLGLLFVKTKTTKVMSIIGISLCSLFLIWDLLMLSSPGGISFDEVGPVFLLYGLLVLAFNIVGIVQSVRYSNRNK